MFLRSLLFAASKPSNSNIDTTPEGGHMRLKHVLKKRE
jgi:hypothetical protein